MSTISVIGAGYVGLVTGACLADMGHGITCVEVDPSRLARLRQGEIPIYEPGLAELVERNVRSGRLQFTEEYSTCVPRSDVVFIAVNTPPLSNGEADVSNVFAAARSVLEYAGHRLIIALKSTVPVGTADEIANIAARSCLQGIEVASNPEFLREGTAVKDFMKPDRIVIGTESAEAGAAIGRLYDVLEAPIVMCSRRSAELAKYASNAFLATRISFMNEISAICESSGADISEVAWAMGMDRRIGPSYLKAGLGWGGSCFPKDVLAMMATAEGYGLHSSILSAAFNVNRRQRQSAFERLRGVIENIERPTVGILGLAFKPGTDDVRESPALEIASQLLQEGVNVRAHDPVAMDGAKNVMPDVYYCEDAHEVASGSDALLVATEWPEYLSLDWHKIRSLMRGRFILDGRNALDGKYLMGLGLSYACFGRAMSPDDRFDPVMTTAAV